MIPQDNEPCAPAVQPDPTIMHANTRLSAYEYAGRLRALLDATLSGIVSLDYVRHRLTELDQQLP